MFSDEDIELFASQIVMPEVGVAGQKRLASGAVVVFGNSRGACEARRYLAAAGVRIREASEAAAPIDCLIIADLDSLSPQDRARAANISAPVIWYRITAGTILTGLAPGIQELAFVSTESRDSRLSDAPVPIAECLAGADAAATAVALILGWASTTRAEEEIDLP